MTNLDNLCKIYRNVFEYLKQDDNLPYIKLYTRGNLFNLIKILLLENNKEAIPKTQSICDELSIAQKTSHQDEISLCHSIVPIAIQRTVNQGEPGKMKLIILGACILVGVGACLAYIQFRRNQALATPKRQEDSYLEQESSERPKPFTLLLVLPYNGRLLNKGMMPIDSLKNLIDSSSFFYCCPEKDVRSIEVSLDELSEDDSIQPGEYGEIYERTY